MILLGKDEHDRGLIVERLSATRRNKGQLCRLPVAEKFARDGGLYRAGGDRLRRGSGPEPATSNLMSNLRRKAPSPPSGMLIDPATRLFEILASPVSEPPDMLNDVLLAQAWQLCGLPSAEKRTISRADQARA